MIFDYVLFSMQAQSKLPNPRGKVSLGLIWLPRLFMVNKNQDDCLTISLTVLARVEFVSTFRKHNRCLPVQTIPLKIIMSDVWFSMCFHIGMLDCMLGSAAVGLIGDKCRMQTL